MPYWLSSWRLFVAVDGLLLLVNTTGERGALIHKCYKVISHIRIGPLNLGFIFLLFLALKACNFGCTFPKPFLSNDREKNIFGYVRIF